MDCDAAVESFLKWKAPPQATFDDLIPLENVINIWALLVFQGHFL